MSEKVINVREVLNQNSYTTTVDELRNRGKRRVRVINAEQISALIEEAVNRVVSQSSGMDREEVKKLVQRSKEEFRRVLGEREKELAEQREIAKKLEYAQEDLKKSSTELERLKIVEAELRKQNESLSAQVSDLKVALQSASSDGGSKANLVKLEQENKELKSSLAELREMEKELRRAESDARKERDRLNDELHEFKEKQPQTAALSPEMTDLLKSLATEVAAVKSELKEVSTKSVKVDSDEVVNKAVAERMDEISKNLSDRLDRIGKKVGVSSAVEVEAVGLEAIFNQQETLESNLENVEIKERKGKGISGAIEKMKSMRQGKKKKN